jgi:hypothetical protein
MKLKKNLEKLAIPTELSALKLSSCLSSKKPFYSCGSWLLRPNPKFWGQNTAAVV